MIILKINKAKLLKSINIINLIIEKKPILPILENLVIKKSKTKIYFIINNINIQIKIKLRTKIFNENLNKKLALGICAKSFLNIIKNFPQCKILLKFKNNKIIIQYKNIKYSLNVIKINEYPIIKFKKSTKNIFISLNKITIINLLDLIYFFINKNNDQLTENTLITIKNNFIEITSTDNYRLAYNKIDLKENLNIKKHILISNKTLIILYNIINKINSKYIKLKLNKSNQIKFKIRNFILISKTINQNYPILTTNSELYKNKFLINRNLLQLSLRRSNVIKNQNLNFANWTIKENILKLTNQNEREKSEEKLNINYKGDNINIGINTNHVLDLINNIKSSNLEFSFSNKLDNIIISIPDKPEFKYITTPIKL